MTMFTKKFERRVYLATVVVLGSGLFGFSFFLYAMWPTNIVTGYAPDQPIKFSHRLHAGEMQIECVYCHTGVETGAHATIPPISTCMNCHSQVHPTNKRGKKSKEIAKLKEHWENNQPIEWNKVNDLADFVYFNHSRHIVSGIDCSECHGQVETMDKVARVNSLKMGWCLDCHMQPPPQPQNEEPPQPVADDVVATMPDAHSHPKVKEFRSRAPVHCNACHR